MKKQFLLVGTICLLVAGTLAGCNGNKKKAGISDVSASGLYPYYYTTDTIEWDDIYLLVTDTNDEITTLTVGEFDIKSRNAESGTEFILETSGLYDLTKNGEIIPVGTYDISYTILDFNGKSYSDDLFTVTVATSLVSLCDAEYFSEPQFQITYNHNIEERVDYHNMEGEESEFFESCDYTVGNDNPFVYRPVLELTSKSDPYGPHIFPNGYPATVTVTYSGVEQDLASNPYVTFNNRTFGFQFTDEAIGKTFTLSVAPSEFSATWANELIVAHEITVTVADGYNVTKALDLGRINLVSSECDDTRLSYYEQAAPRGDVYWREASNGESEYYNEYYARTWENYLTSRGETDLAPINGVFLHGDIDVTIDDLPSEFIISEEELDHQGSSANYNYGEVVGSLRDEIYIYTKVMENDDFVINGNLFTLDCSSLKWTMTRYNEDENRLEYYSRSQTRYEIDQCGLFGISDVVHHEGNTYPGWVLFGDDKKTTTIVNLEAHGNQERAYYDEDTDTSYDASKAAGCIRFIKDFGGKVVARNNITINFVQAYYVYYTPSTFIGMDINWCKVYDCYAIPFYNYGGGHCELDNTVATRFGGPIVLLTSLCAEPEYGIAKWNVGSNVNVNSYLAGSEAWFNLLGISELIVYFDELDAAFRGGGGSVYTFPVRDTTYGKALRNEDGKYNVVFVGMDKGVSSGDPIHIDFTYEEHHFTYATDYEFDEDNPILDTSDEDCFNWVAHAYYSDYGGINSNLGGLAYMPVFVSNTGKIFGIDAISTDDILRTYGVHLIDLVQFYEEYLANIEQGETGDEAKPITYDGHLDVVFDDTVDEDGNIIKDDFIYCLEDTANMKISIGIEMFDYPFAVVE